MDDSQTDRCCRFNRCCGLETWAAMALLTAAGLAAGGFVVSSLIAFEKEDYQLDYQPVRLLKPQPPIVNADTRPVGEAADQLGPSELVLGVTVNGQSRAYPINMLTGPQREIINDRLGGQAIAATW